MWEDNFNKNAKINPWVYIEEINFAFNSSCFTCRFQKDL